MSEQGSNTCERCGGVKRVDWTVSFEQCHPVEMRFDPASLADNWRLCPGHPEPATDVVSPWLIEQVHLAIGRASMCWHTMPSGVFDDAQAKAVAERLIQAIASEQGKHIPGPAQRHDGKLDERGDATASYGKAYLSKSAKDVHIDGYDDGVCLSPKQTLSLLAWLRQEEARLEQLVKEQERG